MPGAEDDKSNNPPGEETAEQKVEREAAEAVTAAAKKKEEEGDLSGMKPEDMAAEIKKLRKENADRRTKNKALDEQAKSASEIMGKLKQALGIEDDKQSPEEMAKQLQDQNAALQMELGIMQVGVQHQIPVDQMEYFSFLFQKRASEMNEGEEMSEEVLAEVIAKAKSAGGAGGKTTTGIDGNGNPPPSGNAGEVTLEKYVKMNPGEKGALYNKNLTLYNKLHEEAKSKRLL